MKSAIGFFALIGMASVYGFAQDPVEQVGFNAPAAKKDRDADSPRQRKPRPMPAVKTPTEEPLLELALPDIKPSSTAMDIKVRPLVIGNCQIKMAEEIRVPAETQGVLTAVNVQEGAVVKKGDILATLDDWNVKLEMEMKERAANNESAVQMAANRIEVYKAEYESGQSLLKTGGISAEEFNRRRAQLALSYEELRDAKIKFLLADIEFEKAEELLRRHVIHSPVSGMVTRRLKHPGESIQSLEPAFHVIKTDRVKLQGQLELRHADRVKPGMIVEVVPNISADELQSISLPAAVNAVCVLPGSRRVAVGCDDGRVVVANLTTGSTEREFKVSHRAVLCLTVSPAEPNQLLSGDEEGNIRFWNLNDGNEIRPPCRPADSQDDAVTALLLDPANPTLGYSGHKDGRIYVWDFRAGTALQSLNGPPRDKAHLNPVTCLCLSPDRRVLLSVGDDKAYRLWDTGKRVHLASQEQRGSTTSREVRQLSFSPSGAEVPFNSDNLLQFRRVRDGIAVGELECTATTMTDFAVFAPTAGLVLLATNDSEIQLWRIATEGRPARLARVYKGHRSGQPIKQIDFGDGGRFFVTAGKDHTVKVWKLPSVAELDSERVPAKVTYVSPQASPSQTIEFQAEVSNRTGVFRGNTVATAIIYPQ